jgi:MFS family permease
MQELLTSSAARRDKAILVAGMVSDRIGMALLFVVFGPLVRDLSISELQFGVLIASANVTLGVASPYWGRRSQAIGRRPVFVIGLAGYALGFLLLAVSLEAGLAGWLAPGPLFVLLLAARLLYGLLAAATQPAATAYVADITAAHDRTRGMALLGAAAGAGMILGPIVGGSLSAVTAVFPLYVAAGLAATVAIVASLRLREPARHAASAARTGIALTDRRLVPYLLGWCLIVLVLTGVQTITAFYLEDEFGLTGREQVTRAISIALLVMGVVMLVVQAIVLQRFRPRPIALLRTGFMVLALSLLVLLAAPGVPVVWLAYALLGLGFSALSSALNAAATLSVAPAEQGAAAGLLATAPVAGMLIGPVLATFLYGHGPAWPLALGAASCAAMGAWFISRRG